MILKQLLPAMLTIVYLLSCHNGSKSSDDKNDGSSAVRDSLAYPFTASYSLKWQPGDEKNALLVLNCLKKYVAGDINGSAAYFADTAEFVGDKFYFKGGRDSLTKILADMRNASAAVSKNFETWATIFYPDKNETWVTLWYTEIMTDKKGRVDSIYYTDDVLIKNDRIVVYDEKQRLFPSPKLK
ncbi:MAG TPA: hypothetical protein VGO21_02355 [Candidatus Paceibacterota bacterium]|nr:hypothetical protein [Candidatus Paceibacterota bacterium]